MSFNLPLCIKRAFSHIYTISVRGYLGGGFLSFSFVKLRKRQISVGLVLNED